MWIGNSWSNEDMWDHQGAMCRVKEENQGQSLGEFLRARQVGKRSPKETKNSLKKRTEVSRTEEWTTMSNGAAVK